MSYVYRNSKFGSGGWRESTMNQNQYTNGGRGDDYPVTVVIIGILPPWKGSCFFVKLLPLELNCRRGHKDVSPWEPSPGRTPPQKEKLHRRSRIRCKYSLDITTIASSSNKRPKKMRVRAQRPALLWFEGMRKSRKKRTGKNRGGDASEDAHRGGKCHTGRG